MAAIFVSLIAATTRKPCILTQAEGSAHLGIIEFVIAILRDVNPGGWSDGVASPHHWSWEHLRCVLPGISSRFWRGNHDTKHIKSGGIPTLGFKIGLRARVDDEVQD
jgi:hypothetical protein